MLDCYSGSHVVALGLMCTILPTARLRETMHLGSRLGPEAIPTPTSIRTDGGSSLELADSTAQADNSAAWTFLLGGNTPETETQGRLPTATRQKHKNNDNCRTCSPCTKTDTRRAPQRRVILPGAVFHFHVDLLEINAFCLSFARSAASRGVVFQLCHRADPSHGELL